MPRYFFHVRDDREHIDTDGVELTDDPDARVQAVVAAGEALRDLRHRFWATAEWRMRVEDERGMTVCALTVQAEKLDEPVAMY